MIYLITGVPGSGKTLYAVSTLVQTLLSQKLRHRGKELQRRLVVDGVPDLVLPHDVMAPLVEDEKGVLTCEGQGLTNWYSWCKPGDVILVDEVQRYWRPRGLGTKPPDMIKHLETHRHLGVDFVVITQNPMLIDQNVRRLVGRHQHVRRLFGLSRAAIYDWDGCSVDVHRTRSATMSLWSYPKSAYSLYKSSELHTKQKQKIPPWLIVPVLALVGGLAVAPTAFGTLSGAMTGKGVSTLTATASASAPSQPLPPVAPALPPAAPGLSAPMPLGEVLKPSGCIVYPGGRCKCMDTQGGKIDMDMDLCRDLAHPGQKVVDGAAFSELPRVQVVSPEEMDLYQFVARQRGPKL
ncbi:MAG: zonular occludens toxin domain-containing protein [Hylemonella sp.]|nr:zonular occludens toxin domain-containing protein [Hylemonella sp.]